MNVLALPERAADDDDDTLPHVVVKQRAVLPINVSEISRPVAMETGFTVPYSSMMQIRKQVRTSTFKCPIQNPLYPKLIKVEGVLYFFVNDGNLNSVQKKTNQIHGLLFINIDLNLEVQQ